MRGRGRGHRRRWRGASRRAVRFVEPTLLLLLHYGPAHGYTLIEQLHEYGLADVDPSAVYRALRDMEERGWVLSSWEEEQTQGPPRRVYRLTPLGDEMLGWWAQDLQETRTMIDHLVGAYDRHMEEGEGEHHQEGTMYNYILVPLDGSNRAEAILPHVEELGKRYDAQVIFLRVVEPMPISVGPGEASMLVPQEEIDRRTEQAIAYLDNLQEQFHAKDIEARTCVYYGPVVQAIIDAAECECADLIAMASHGRSGTSQVFYGSVAVGVLHRADRPLLLVRSRDSEQEEDGPSLQAFFAEPVIARAPASGVDSLKHSVTLVPVEGAQYGSHVMVGQTAGNAAHWIEHIAEHAADFRLWAGLAVEADADISAAAAWMEAASKGLAELGGSMVNHDYHHQHD